MKGERRLKLVPPAGSPPEESGSPALVGGSGRAPGSGLAPEDGLAPGSGPAPEDSRAFEMGDEPPPTEAELREARAQMEAMEQGADPLAAALRAAFHPDALDEVDHDALLARAFGDASAPPTKAERAAADRLASELDAAASNAVKAAHAAHASNAVKAAHAASAAHVAITANAANPVNVVRAARAPAGPPSEQAELASALRSAWAPRAIEPLRNEALIASALVKMKAPAAGRRGRALPVTMAALATVAAMAAGVALFLGRTGDFGAPASQTAASPGSKVNAVAQVSLIRARSAAELFDPETPFPRTGGTSSRIDRIASARAADLRANRFAAWGVP